MSIVRDIIKALAPHGYVMSRHRNHFVREYLEWKRGGGRVSFDKQCKFKSIVTIDGFGCSGSSVVMDLLREYDNCVVWATRPAFAASDVSNIVDLGEMNLVRHTGGLLFLEKMLADDCTVNDFWADAAVKSFIHLVYYSDIYQHYPETRKYFFHFFDSIIYQHLRSEKNLLNNYLFLYSNITDIFNLRSMPLTEYHALCRGLLYSLFNVIFKDTDRDTLVIDHIFGDCGFDMSRFEPYLPGIRRIQVSRDIRAVYVHAKRNRLEWLAHDSVEEFLKWEEKMYRGADRQSEACLSVRFEDMVMHYDAEVERIERFLQLQPRQHVMKRQIFDPDISRANIDAWRKAAEYARDCEEIARRKPSLCYNI